MSTNKLVLEYLDISDALLYQLQRSMYSRRMTRLEIKHCNFPANLDSLVLLNYYYNYKKNNIFYL